MTETITLTAGESIEGADTITVVAFGKRSQGDGPEERTVTLDVVRNEAIVTPAD